MGEGGTLWECKFQSATPPSNLSNYSKFLPNFHFNGPQKSTVSDFGLKFWANDRDRPGGGNCLLQLSGQRYEDMWLLIGNHIWGVQL